MKRTIYIFGGIAGAIVAVLMSISMLMAKNNQHNFDWGMIIGYTSMLLAFTLIFVGIKTYRDKQLNGIISFGKAFLTGIGIACVASVIYAFTWYVMYTTVYPEFPKEYAAYTLQKMQAAGKPAAEIEATKAQIASAFSYYDTWYGVAGLTFMEIFPVGLLVTIISSLVLKRKAAPVPVRS